MTDMAAAQFVEKWKKSKLRERQASQEQLIDLCRLLDHPTPAEADSVGEEFCFDRGAKKPDGSDGWADVWKKGHFGWEYKGKQKDLEAAYHKQLCLYRDALENPPLLIVSDMERFIVRTNFNDTVQETHVLSLDDLMDTEKLAILHAAFHQPELLRPALTREALTHGVAAEFSTLAEKLVNRYGESMGPRIAHFVNRMVFCMFAEDIGLLPDKLFQRTLEAALVAPQDFRGMVSGLFKAMATGGRFDLAKVDHFNGSLFDDDEAIDLTSEEIVTVLDAARKNWADIDPSIFGTLFEQGVDPALREELGMHYTRAERIQRIVDIVIVHPLAAEWETAKKSIVAKLDQANKTFAIDTPEIAVNDHGLTEKDLKARNENRKKVKAARDKTRRLQREAERFYNDFLGHVRSYRVLDPACGSGNFLYLALLALKNLEHQAGIDAERYGLARQFPAVGPECVSGIEKSEYAAELARVTIWIGELQWMRRYGYAIGRRPILRPLDNILMADAVLTADGKEPQWPKADAIIGNPPFKGDRWMTESLGRVYVEALHELYAERVPKSSNQVLYWFEKARAQVVAGKSKRVGLVATSTIRNPNNRPVVNKIIQDTDVFAVWPNEEWYEPAPGAPRLDASAVRVAMVCFATQGEGDTPALLNESHVATINSDFSSGIDLTKAATLRENHNTAFQGAIPWGEGFVVSGKVARRWLGESGNPNGRPNSDVLRHYPIAQDIAHRPRDEWIIDFGDMSEAEASLYDAPFSHVEQHVKQGRMEATQEKAQDFWWKLWNPRPKYRAASAGLDRVIVTPRVSEHRFFRFMRSVSLPDTRLVAIASNSYAIFGVLESRFHRVWCLRKAAAHGVGDDPTYGTRNLYRTFPFPDCVPAREHAHNLSAAIRIANTARNLDSLREEWLNPSGWTIEDTGDLIGDIFRVPARTPKNPTYAKKLAKRTMTSLLNTPPPWLKNAQRELDEAVADAYGWKSDISDDEVVEKLLALNLERSRKEKKKKRGVKKSKRTIKRKK